jgi:hypothetical protein
MECGLSGTTETLPRLRARPIRWNHGLLVGAAASALLLGLGSAGGGYFPTSWGWAALALAWAAGVALVVREEIHVGSLELATCGALAAFVLWIGVRL